MGTMKINGGGAQIVQYRTASGHKSKRLAYNESTTIEVNNTGDKLYLDFCFLTCGSPSAGPADVLPGDEAQADARLWHGINLAVWRKGVKIYDKSTDGT